MPESLQAKLAVARRRWRALKTVGGLASVFAVLTACALVSFYSDRLLILGTGGRLGWLLALLAAFAASALAFVVLPLRRPIPDEAVATEVERCYPALGERLLTTIELAHAGAGAGVSGAMVSALIRETERLAAPLDFLRAIPTAPLRRPTPFAAVAAVVLFAHAAVAPGAAFTWLRRILFPMADIPIYAHTQVWVTPGDAVVPRGEAVAFGIRTGGRAADRAVLHYRVDGGKWTEVALASSPALKSGANAPPFALTLPDTQQSLTYYATANDGRSNPYTLRVEDRPTILNVRLRLNYPAYTGLPPKMLDATAGNVVAPVGTNVEFTATANKPLREARLIEDGKDCGPREIVGETVRAGLKVTRDMTYGLRLRDHNGFEARTPPQYTVHADPDKTPVVQITKPGADVERTPNGMVNLRVNASDDYGVRELRLAYRVGKRAGSVALPGADGRPQAASGGPWHLGSLPLKPGDTLVYEAQARDNDTISGPHVGRSAAYCVQIIGANEMKERLDAAVAQEQEALRQLIQRQKEAQTQLQKARQNPRADATQQAEGAQRNVAQEAADLARRMQQTTEQMRDNNLSGPTEQQRREAAQQNLQQLAQKAMPAAADTIRRGALPDAAQQEQAIKEALERLAQQSARTSDAAQLAQQAEQLAQAQQRLAEQSDLAAAQMSRKSPAQMSAQERARLAQLARKPADLRAQTQALQQQLQQAARDARERGQPNAADLQRAAQQLQQSGAQQKQSAAQQNLQSGRPSDASPPQNEAARDLQNLANNLDQIGQKQSAQAAEKRAEQMDQLADRLNQLADAQKKVADQTRWNPDAEASRRLAEQEQSLNQRVQQIAPELRDIPQAQQGVQRASQNIQQSANALNRGAPAAATSTALEATRQLRQAALEAMQAAQNLRQQQEAKEAQRNVEKLAREQRALRQQTGQLDRARQNGGLTPEQQKRAAALAQQQEQLTERSRTLKQDISSQAFQWALGEATRRMDNAARGLQQQNTGEETQRHQETAAQTLERIARALGQQAQGAQQQAQSGGQQSGGSQQQMAQASGELQLAREMQAQIRQETGSLDQRRSRNPNRNLTAEQQRELNYLNQAQRKTQEITDSAARQLQGTEVGQTVQRAAEQMEDVQDLLQQQQTGQPTQQRQERIVGMLDKALEQTRQAMRQQRQQQMARQGQPQGQQPGQPQRGNQPASRTFAPITQAQPGAFGQVNQRGRGFGALTPRDQQSLREGREERVPAEYRDLVNQYYKALSERGGK